MQKQTRILVTGASGLVGRALVKKLLQKGYTNLTGTCFRQPAESEFGIPLHQTDFRSQQEVAGLFDTIRPESVFMAAARVGGILANHTLRADFIYDNLLIHIHTIHQSYLSGVQKLLYLGSTCIYPRDCPQPMQESDLLTAPLEYTNEPYAIAKIAGLKLCESYNLQYGTNYIAVMPTNLYGPGDNFDLKTAHVLPALLRKIHLARLLEQQRWPELLADVGLTSENDARQMLAELGVTAARVDIWGSGEPRREFLWSEDMADACVYLMEQVNFADLAADRSEVRNTHINIGTGVDVSIAELAARIRKLTGFTGTLRFDRTKPDGTPRKLTDISKLKRQGWQSAISLDEGLKQLYAWYLNQNRNQNQNRNRAKGSCNPS